MQSDKYLGGRLRRLTVAVLLAAAAVIAAPIQVSDSAEGGSLAARAIGATDSASWQYARKLASQSGDPVARKLVQYLYLSSSRSSPSFAEIADFLIANPKWPGRKELTVKAEHSFLTNMPPRERAEWFRRYPPYTAKAKFLAAETFMQTGDHKTGQRILSDLWRSGGFERDIEQQILRKYGHDLDKLDHQARFDGLLWRGQRDAANRMFKLVGRDMELLGKARLALRYRAPDVEVALSHVPNLLRADAGLFYERVHWRLNNGKPELALELARKAAGSLRPPLSQLGDQWWDHQQQLARMALEVKDYKTAYAVASTHNYKLPGEAAPLPRRTGCRAGLP